MIASPVVSRRLSVFRKNSLRPPLKRTSTTSNLSSVGISMLESQSNTFILLHPPVWHAPLLLQPETAPSFLPDPHEQPIPYIDFRAWRHTRYLSSNFCKSTPISL